MLGVVLSLAALLGFARRLCFALSTLLYLSYVTVTRDFLSFQWDNLLIECGLLAAFLRTDGPAPVAHFLFRLVLFKLYFESGIAKWGSPLRDWHDGSAMTYYYETAPLPTWLAWYAHHLPVWWHHFESRATLVLELVLPFAIFGPRRLRLVALAAFTSFQIVNAATANYGFFCYLAVVLGVFLLDDADVARAGAAVGRLARFVPAAVLRLNARVAGLAAKLPRLKLPPLLQPGAHKWLAVAGAGLFALLSVADANVHFGQPAPALAFINPLLELDWRLRLVNTYHLFASITRERIEPEFQTLAEGPLEGREPDDAAWTAQHLRHKPGDLARRARFRGAPPAARRFPALVLRPRLPAPFARLRLRVARAPVRGAPGRAAAVSRPTAPSSDGGSPRVLAVSVHQRPRETRHRRLVAADAPRDDARGTLPRVP